LYGKKHYPITGSFFTTLVQKLINSIPQKQHLRTTIGNTSLLQNTWARGLFNGAEIWPITETLSSEIKTVDVE